MVLINAANLCCQAFCSVLASFFPREAKAKSMSDELVGVVFAVFALVGGGGVWEPFIFKSS